MQSGAKHLAWESNSIAWITTTREMLRCALHDGQITFPNSFIIAISGLEIQVFVEKRQDVLEHPPVMAHDAAAVGAFVFLSRVPDAE